MSNNKTHIPAKAGGNKAEETARGSDGKSSKNRYAVTGNSPVFEIRDCRANLSSWKPVGALRDSGRALGDHILQSL